MSKYDISLNELWQGKSAPQPSVNALIEKVRKVKTTSRIKVILTTLALSLSSVFLCWIWITSGAVLFTTKSGLTLIILAMGIYGYSLNGQYQVLNKLDEADSNSGYLNNLLNLKRKQQFLQTTLMNIYFVLISLGVSLSMIEPAQQMKGLWIVVAYSLTFAWICLAWFYLRPRQIQKQNSKLNEMIRQFETIQSQLKKD